MEDPYDFVNHGAQPQGVAALCKRVASAKGKDALIKGLKQLASILEEAPQDLGSLGRAAAAELPRTAASLLHHGDKDVRLYTAVVVVHMLRIWAPDTPFEGEPEALEVRRGGARAQQSVHSAPRARPTVVVLGRGRHPCASAWYPCDACGVRPLCEAAADPCAARRSDQHPRRPAPHCSRAPCRCCCGWWAA
jgi:hypothetical protein